MRVIQVFITFMHLSCASINITYIHESLFTYHIVCYTKRFALNNISKRNEYVVILHYTSSGARTFPAKTFPPDGTTFAQISLGQRLSKDIPPYGYWNMQFYQSEAAYVKFDYNIPRGASIGVYARRNALPTHTQYHILEVLSGFKARTTRGSYVSFRQI